MAPSEKGCKAPEDGAECDRLQAIKRSASEEYTKAAAKVPWALRPRRALEGDAAEGC